MIAVGIDLGTTATVIAVVQNGVPHSISSYGGMKTTPSVVNFGEDGIISIGREALSKIDCAHTVFSVKRSMGSDDKFFEKTPEEISANILSFVKKIAEKELDEEINSAVITVPAHFSDIQRTATKRAASLAGIKVLRLINEPTSAAIAFGLSEKVSGIYAVYDFGGGTFDFSILRLSDDGIFQVLATGGDNYLGGDDIDNEILEYNFRLCGINIFEVNEAEKLLAKSIVKSMKEHCNFENTIQKDCFLRGKRYEFQLSAKILSELSKKYIEKTFQIADEVFSDANLNHNEVDGILLVGGMTKMRIVKDSVREYFKVRVFDNVDPEEVVALGAAIQADSIINKNSNTLLIDVVPLTLGIETFGGGVDKIIHRNTPIPAVETREYTTYADNQTGMKFHIVQGERALAEDCRSIANFEMIGIPPAIKGVPRIEVKFSVDVNGLLNITAYETKTGIKQNITVEPSSGLTEKEMISMLESAMKNMEKDKSKSAYLSAKMDAENKISFWKSIVNDIPTPEKNEINEKITKLSEIIKNTEIQNAKNISDLIDEVDSIVGRFIDDIISSRLSKNPIKIDTIKTRL